MRFIVALVAAVAFLSNVSPSLLRAEDLVDNPLYASWAKLKPGSSITMSMNTNAMGQEVKSELTQKLAEVTPDQLIIETINKMQVMGQERVMGPTKVTIKAKVPKDQADRTRLPQGMKGQTKELADEMVEAAGKSYNCKVMEFTGEVQGTTAKGKIWRSDEVPGGMVKTEVNTEGAMVSTSTSKLVAIDLK
jgi:hypothetical protein